MCSSFHVSLLFGSFTIQGCCPHLVKEKKNMYCSMHQTCVQLAAFAVVLCIRARTVTLTKAFSAAYHCQCFQISSRADWNENQGHGFSIASNAKLLQMQSIASFLYRPFLQMPWESKHWSANRGKTYPPKITQLRKCARKIHSKTT